MRPSYLIALAVVVGLLVSFWVSKILSSSSSPSARIVVAVSNINPGQVLTLKDVKIIPWFDEKQQSDAFKSPDQLVGRVARQAIYPGEVIMSTDLAPEGARGGLASTIQPGKRAISVRVNDVVAVAGFAYPGSFVDVLVSAKTQAGEPFSKIVLHRVKVLAIAQETSSDPSKPRVVNAVTLELTPAESEELDLARSVGSLSFVLRNELDKIPVTASGASLDGLMISRPASAPPIILNDQILKPTPPLPVPVPVIEMRGTALSKPILGPSQ